jgi:hypothetical protein
VRREARDTRLGAYWVQYEAANLVDWGAFRVPETFTAGFSDERFRILIEVLLDEHGPECVAISRLDDAAPPLTSERRFPLRAMVNAAVRAAAFELVDVPIEEVDPGRKDPRLVPDERGHVRVWAPAFDGHSEERASPGSHVGRNELQHVAALYRRAVASGLSPSSAIADEFGITRSTARKWVQRARASGFLGPAVGRRVGEEPRPARSAPPD